MDLPRIELGSYDFPFRVLITIDTISGPCVRRLFHAAKFIRPLFSVERVIRDVVLLSVLVKTTTPDETWQAYHKQEQRSEYQALNAMPELMFVCVLVRCIKANYKCAQRDCSAQFCTQHCRGARFSIPDVALNLVRHA